MRATPLGCITRAPILASANIILQRGKYLQRWGKKPLGVMYPITDAEIANAQPTS